MSTGLLNRSKVLQTTHQFLAIAEKQGVESAAAPVRSQLEIYRKREFQVLVVGEVKRGKSTFINALLGEADLLPIDTHVATSTVYKVMYGDTKRYKIFFNPSDDSEGDAQSPRTPIETTDPAEVAEYGTEDRNPGNEKEVNRIEVYVPNPLLKSGAAIVDTPGLQSVVGEHGNILWNYAPAASAICFVLDSVESPATVNDIANLKEFLKIAEQTSGNTPPLFFVQTKVDLVEEEQWQTYRDRNVQIIQENLPEYFAQPGVELHYFPISSERKALADTSPESDVPDSGFSPVLELIEGTTQKQAERSARELLKPIQDMTVEKLQPHVANTRELLRRSYAGDQKGRTAELTEITSHLAKWQKEIYPEVFENFKHQADLLKIEATEQLTRLDPHSNPFLSSTIRNMRDNTSQWSSEKIANEADLIQAACVEHCNEAISDILGTYQVGMNTLIKESGNKLLESLEYGGTITPTKEITSSEKLDTAAYSKFGLFQSAGSAVTFAVIFLSISAGVLSSFAGGAAVGAGAVGAGAVGAGAGAGGAGGAAVVVGGPVLIVPVLIGVAVYAYIAYRKHKKDYTLGTIASLEKLLSKVILKARQEASNQVGRVTHAYQKEVSDYFKKATNEVVDSAQRNIATIKEGSNLDAKTYEEKMNALKNQEEAINNLQNTLEEMLGTSTQAASVPSQ